MRGSANRRAGGRHIAAASAVAASVIVCALSAAPADAKALCRGRVPNFGGMPNFGLT
jgi:hypothetical protein